MARRPKATGCTKFLLVMIILVPLAFIGASLYNGKNPVDAFKALLGGELTVVEDGLTTTENGNQEISNEKANKEIPIRDENGSNTAESQPEMTDDSDIQKIQSRLDQLEDRIKQIESQLSNQKEEN